MAAGPTCQPFSPSSLSFFSLLPLLSPCTVRTRHCRSEGPAARVLARSSRTSGCRPCVPAPCSPCGPPCSSVPPSIPGEQDAVAAQPSPLPPAALDSSSPVRLPSIPCAGSFPVLSSPDSGPHTIDSPSACPPRRSSIPSAGRPQFIVSGEAPFNSLRRELPRPLLARFQSSPGRFPYRRSSSAELHRHRYSGDPWAAGSGRGASVRGGDLVSGLRCG